ncbi:MAG: Rpn family recombination-promoting nuclease/putative transposase [Eubacteriales bacterium]|nr:Rpn family recombination-promoting nuclease/putative transposase [Eubacteriales bacterium]
MPDVIYKAEEASTYHGKDITEKTLEDYNDVFADIVNVLLFGGRAVVREDELTAEKQRSIYKADGKLHEQERDVSKFWNRTVTEADGTLALCNVRIALLGLENQTAPDEDAPFRVISYDGAAYRGSMLADKKVKPKVRYPVITLVLYFGSSHWDEPLTLKGALKKHGSLPEELDPYVSDYRVNLFEISWLSPEQVELFKSDFRHVADYFVQMRMNKDYKPSQDKLRHVHEVLQLMTILTGDYRFEESISMDDGKEATSMCEVLDRVEARGIENTKLIDIRNIMSSLKYSAEEAMDILKVPEEERDKYLRKLGING